MKISIKHIVEFQRKHKLSVIYTLVLVIVVYAFIFRPEVYLKMYKSINDVAVILLIAVLVWIASISESIDGE